MSTFDKRNRDFCKALTDMQFAYIEAEAENAELFKLVHVMAYCMQHERECDGCRLNGADGTITAPVGCDGLLDRMRELFGKENDGCDLV